MLDAGWEELDPTTAGLAEARLALHHAIQLVAAVGQALAPRAEDDSQQSQVGAFFRSAMSGAGAPATARAS